MRGFFSRVGDGEVKDNIEFKEGKYFTVSAASSSDNLHFLKTAF